MKTSLTDILKEALIGKKIKLYKVLDKTRNPKGLEYYLTDKDEIAHPKKCEIIGESVGIIISLKTEYEYYEGDSYNFLIHDISGNSVHFNGLYSITSNLEIIE